VKAVQQLPTHPRLLLCVAAVVFADDHRQATLRKFQEVYQTLSARLGLPMIDPQSFVEFLSMLTSMNMIEVEGVAKRGSAISQSSGTFVSSFSWRSGGRGGGGGGTRGRASTSVAARGAGGRGKKTAGSSSSNGAGSEVWNQMLTLKVSRRDIEDACDNDVHASRLLREGDAVMTAARNRVDKL
jgi:Cdc6-like AAA superfamily ATPase